MKRYPQIISKLFYEPLLITHARHSAMARILEKRMAEGMPDEDPEEPENPVMPGWQRVGPDAIIPVSGVLVGHASDIPMSSCGCGMDDVAGMIDVALADRAVKRLIFNFNTPGGAVVGTPELGRKIAGIVSKQTIAFTDSECCSGGVWLATQCQQFCATESAAVGSIGVWCAYMDSSRQLANQGTAIQEISAGKYKTMGAYWKPLTAEERGMIQKQIDKIYGQFKEVVNLHRVVADEFMQGQIFDGAEAQAIGLIDGVVDGIEDVLS
jgi:protease-4